MTYGFDLALEYRKYFIITEDSKCLNLQQLYYEYITSIGSLIELGE
jgi:hypothetical protein